MLWANSSIYQVMSLVIWTFHTSAQMTADCTSARQQIASVPFRIQHAWTFLDHLTWEPLVQSKRLLARTWWYFVPSRDIQSRTFVGKRLELRSHRVSKFKYAHREEFKTFLISLKILDTLHQIFSKAGSLKSIKSTQLTILVRTPAWFGRGAAKKLVETSKSTWTVRRSSNLSIFPRTSRKMAEPRSVARCRRGTCRSTSHGTRTVRPCL